MMYVQGIETLTNTDQELTNGTSHNRKASVRQKTLSIRQKDHQ